MKRILVTGCAGFVGEYLIDYILQQEHGAEIFGIDVIEPRKRYPERVFYSQINLLDRERVENVLEHIDPDCIVHLASFSSVGDSWKNPITSFKNNTNIFLNVLETVHVMGLKCRILSPGSSEQYGIVQEEDLPITEQAPLQPVSPYAAARIAQEHLSLIYARSFGLDVVCTRSFNHIGPGQPDKFVISSIAKQFAENKLGLKKGLLLGNIRVVRDFLDVRDVVGAYYLLLKKGERGEVYNVCSGKGIPLLTIIKSFSKISGLEPSVEVSKTLLRPMENPMVVGSHEKIAKLGWYPGIALHDSLRDIYEYWMDGVRTGKQAARLISG